MKDSGAVIRMAVSCTCRDGGFQKNFEIFSEIRGQNTTCLAITPIEGHLVAGFVWIRLFFKKAGKTLIIFKKIRIYGLEVFLRKVAKRGSDSGFLTETIKKIERFSEKTQIFTERLPKKSEYT